MRIACPSCGADYDVPDRLLSGPARTLRCSRCGADFALPQMVPVAVEPAAPVPEPVVAVMPLPAPKPEPPPRATAGPRDRAPMANAPASQATLMRAWAASVVVVAGGVLALLVFRSQVMATWPPATRLFVVLGLA